MVGMEINWTSGRLYSMRINLIPFLWGSFLHNISESLQNNIIAMETIITEMLIKDKKELI